MWTGWILFSFLACCSSAEYYTNPIKKTSASDPFIQYYNGYFYYMATTWTELIITRAKTINGLKTGQSKTVYKETGGERCCNIWAPEIHEIDGNWYIYFTAGNGKDLGTQRPFVLKGGNDPWGAYTFNGRLLNEWGIDGTVATIKSKKYFFFSCQRNKLQSLCGGELRAPNKVGPTYLVSSPTLGWERKGQFPVNEGPEHISHGGKDYIVYSASQCASIDYALGQLSLTGPNPLDAASWKKSGPIMRSANGNFGPGHNGFFKSPDGKEDWIVYHATSNSKGDCGRNRYTMIGRVNWTDSGPQVGNPPPLSTRFTGPSGEP